MADQITDTRNAARPNTARATGTRSTGGTSLACDNLAGWPVSPRKVHFVTYQIDSDSNPVTGTQLDCSGVVSGNTIGSFTVIDGTDTGNSVNDVVEMLPTAAWGQDLADALTNQHTRTGAHSGITTDTITVTSGTTLPAGDLATADHANASITADKLATGAQAAVVATSESTSGTSYTNLATPGPAVTVTIGVNGLALVSIGSGHSNSVQDNAGYIGFAISGATTVAATDSFSVSDRTNTANFGVYSGRTFLVTGLAAGSTTFTVKYRTEANSETYADRRISVVPL